MTNVQPGAVAIIVVNYGSSALLAENLVPLHEELPAATVVVVDNLTSPDERERVRELGLPRGWLLEEPAENTGFGVGVNRGAARAVASGARWLLILNPDATIRADAVEALVERSRVHPFTLFSPRIVRPDGSTWFDGADLHLADGRLRNRSARPASGWEPWLTGACLLTSVELWERVGGFDPDYFLYWEDVDLSHRVLLAGGALEVCDDVIAMHAEGGTQGEGHESAGLAKSDTYYYFTIRNRLLFARKHLDEAAQRAWFANARAVAWETLLQGGRRQFLHSLRPLLVARRALRDGRDFAVVKRTN
jgi:GT2 family glycosyltransferase